MPTSVKATLYHALELAVVLGIVYLAGKVSLLGFVSDNTALSAVVLSGVAKFVRATGTVKDYVNGK